MTAQPVALMAPVRPVARERPEARRVVWNAQVAELVHDHVVEHLARREHQPPLKESVPRAEHEPQSVRCPPIRIRW
jgi:hypothetical protein